MTDDWQDISTAPIGKTILFWWRPRSQNPFTNRATSRRLACHPLATPSTTPKGQAMTENWVMVLIGLGFFAVTFAAIMTEDPRRQSYNDCIGFLASDEHKLSCAKAVYGKDKP